MHKKAPVFEVNPNFWTKNWVRLFTESLNFFTVIIYENYTYYRIAMLLEYNLFKDKSSSSFQLMP